jgi:hypothetical protein
MRGWAYKRLKSDTEASRTALDITVKGVDERLGLKDLSQTPRPSSKKKESHWTVTYFLYSRKMIFVWIRNGECSCCHTICLVVIPKNKFSGFYGF